MSDINKTEIINGEIEELNKQIAELEQNKATMDTVIARFKIVRDCFIAAAAQVTDEEEQLEFDFGTQVEATPYKVVSLTAVSPQGE